MVVSSVPRINEIGLRRRTQPSFLHLLPSDNFWSLFSSNHKSSPSNRLCVKLASSVQVTMASFSPLYSLSESVERGREGLTDVSEDAQTEVISSISSLLSEDKVFVRGGVTIDGPEEGCSLSPIDYEWTSHDVSEHSSLFVNRAVLLDWINNNCILRALGYNSAMRFVACRRYEMVFHEEGIMGGDCFYFYSCVLFDLYVRFPFTRF